MFQIIIVKPSKDIVRIFQRYCLQEELSSELFYAAFLLLGHHTNMWQTRRSLHNSREQKNYMPDSLLQVYLA